MYHKYIQSLSNLPPFANKIQWSISLYFDTLNILPIYFLSFSTKKQQHENVADFFFFQLLCHSAGGEYLILSTSKYC